jgi:hypothetical protein
LERNAEAEEEELVYSEALSIFLRIEGGALDDEDVEEVMVDVRRAAGRLGPLPLVPRGEVGGRVMDGEPGEEGAVPDREAEVGM